MPTPSPRKPTKSEKATIRNANPKGVQMRATGRSMWILVVVSAVIFVFSAAALARRIAEYNRAAGFVRYSAVVEDRREFTLPAYPTVRLTDATDAEGRAVLRLDYGGRESLIPVKPPVAQLPNLAAYDEWLEVLAVNEVGLDERHNSVAKPGTERLLIVSRRTPDGFNPDTWGSVRRDEWLFDFHELKPDGSIATFTRRWPRGAPGVLANLEQKLQTEADKSDDERLKAFAAIPPLAERSAEYFAAMFVIPKLNVPKHKFSDTALSWRVLGWTLPASMLSGLVLVPALFFAIASARQSAPRH